MIEFQSLCKKGLQLPTTLSVQFDADEYEKERKMHAKAVLVE